MPALRKSLGHGRSAYAHSAGSTRVHFHQLSAPAELNQGIRKLLEKLNHRPFKKRPGCRASLFAELNRPGLKPLPAQRFELRGWAEARVNIDYHVEVERHYSVPYKLKAEWVEINVRTHSLTARFGFIALCYVVAGSLIPSLRIHDRLGENRRS